jgi:capsular polysaccharide biosynthesis protein
MINDDYSTIDIKALLEALWNSKFCIAAITVIFGAVAYLYSYYFITPVYTANTSLYIMNTRLSAEDSIDVSDITVSQLLINTYTIVLKSDVVMDNISQRLLEKYGAEKMVKYFDVRADEDGKLYIPPKELSSMLSLSTIDDTEILNLSATTPEPELSMDICNYLVDIAPDSVMEYVGVSYINPVGRAKLPTAPSAPNVKRNTFFGAIAGFVLVCALVVLRELINNAVRDAETISRVFDMPVLGEIPKYNLNLGGDDVVV